MSCITATSRNFIERLGERFNIREIAFDRWGAVQMVQNLEGMGFTVVPFGQGFKDMSPPTKELMKLVLEEKIAHGGHPSSQLDDGQHLSSAPTPPATSRRTRKNPQRRSMARLRPSWRLTVPSAAGTTRAKAYTTPEGFWCFEEGA
jgi:hypothetical protein